MFSGIFQQGDAIGYLASALFNLYVVPDFESTWKLLFYIGGGFTFIIAILRMVVGESKQFVDQAERARQNPELQLSGSRKIRAFKSDIIYMVKEFWGRSLYAVVLMSKLPLAPTINIWGTC